MVSPNGKAGLFVDRMRGVGFAVGKNEGRCWKNALEVEGRRTRRRRVEGRRVEGGLVGHGDVGSEWGELAR